MEMVITTFVKQVETAGQDDCIDITDQAEVQKALTRAATGVPSLSEGRRGQLPPLRSFSSPNW